MIISLLLIIIGIALLIKGADLLVNSSSKIAKKFHISEIIIGLTIVSIGTSMPELFVSFTSATNNHSDISIGNVIGSNIANLLLILGISSAIKSIPFKKETSFYEIPMCLFFTLIFLFFSNTSNIIDRNESIVLIILFLFFIAYTILMARREIPKNTTKDENKNEAILINIIYLIFGIIALKFGSNLAVENAVIIANYFNISEKIIGITILAIGTSLPELFTSVSAAIKGKTDIAIGNIIGSNIFNMLLIIGVSAFLNPIEYNISYNYDFMLLIISTVLLSIFPFIPPKNEMSKMNGLVYLIIYIIYMGSLFFK